MDQQPARQLNRLILFSRLFSRILLLSLAVYSVNLHADTPPATQFKLPPNHQSTYLIEKFDTVVGEMHNELHYENNLINYTSTATAKGIAALFISVDPKETSVLHWSNDTPEIFPRQQSYNYFQEKAHKKNQQMTFSYNAPNNIQIKGSYKNKPYAIEFEQPVWARQFLPFLMSSDLLQNPDITQHSFFITNKGRIQKYTYTLVANETLEFQSKTLAVKKFKISKKGSRRMSYAWVSAAYYYLPLKIEQYKDGDLNGRLLLTNLKLK